MPSHPHLHEDRLIPADPSVRAIARALYAGVKDLPIISPHGHTDPRWCCDNAAFDNPSWQRTSPTP